LVRGVRCDPDEVVAVAVDRLELLDRQAVFGALEPRCSEVGQFFAGTIPPAGYGSREASTTNMQVDYVRVWSLG
jgi:hypothetical protein